MAKTPFGDEKNLVTRAFAAHYRSAAAGAPGIDPDRHPQHGQLVQHGSHYYIVLTNGQGVIGIYRVHNNGMLRFMRRPPKDLLHP